LPRQCDPDLSGKSRLKSGIIRLFQADEYIFWRKRQSWWTVNLWTKIFSLMKTSIAKRFLFVPIAVVLALGLGGWTQKAFAQSTPQTGVADASNPDATPADPPPNIIPGSPYAEVVRLTQAGVDEDIIMTYVTNSTSTFNLNSDKIIYLTNLGAPTSVIKAMMQRDQELQAQFAAYQAAQQAQQTSPPAVTEAAPPAGNAATNTTEETSPPPPVTVNYFYDTLSPYGSWVSVSGYGNCWRPTVCLYDSNWQPYCDHGHWIYTDCGWYWTSDYAWGATFHYGRWFYNASFGWCWYPGTVWAPSWVTWRYSNNYCGWAPLPPRTTYQAGVGIVYNGGNVSVGFGFGLGANCYTFVPTRYFCSPHPRYYCVAPAQVAQVYNNSTVINNYDLNNRAIVNHGIAVQNVAAASRTTIHPVPVRRVDSSFEHYRQGQPYYHSGYTPAGYRPPGTRDFGSPLRTPQSSSPQPSGVTQNHFPQAGHQNGVAPQVTQPRYAGNPGQVQGQHNLIITGIPRHSTLAESHQSKPELEAVPVRSTGINNSPQSSMPAQPVRMPQDNPPQAGHQNGAVPQNNRPQYAVNSGPVRSQGSIAIAEIPRVAVPAANHQYRPSASPAAINNSQHQFAPSQSQPMGTPRNETSHNESRPNYHQPSAGVAPQYSSGRASAPSPSPSQQGGYHGGYQYGMPH
jgi:hypothetical protein